MSDIVERLPLSQIAYNVGLEVRYAIASAGIDPIQHIPAVDAIIERRLVEARNAVLEEAAKTVETMTFPDGGNPLEAGIILAGKIVCRNAAAAIRALREEE